MVRTFLIFLFVLFSSAAVAEQPLGQPRGEAASPAERIVRAFYAWYGGECAKKMMDYLCAETPQGRRYVHGALRKWLRKVRETETDEMEGEKALDYFWQAQDFSALATSSQYAHQVIVSVQFDRPHYLLVTLKKENGEMKIIRVENVMQ
ncbi:MAG: YbjP/YqhG family protein [Azoarcus sp.]|jgi:hypothetical protein|nr:YbjP/YqhG family protein [Azoarcus sp.]